jgi:cytochrome c-type biogenesis protein CcmH
MNRWLAGLLLLCWLPVYASIEVYAFDTPQQEADYTQLIKTLRCVVCQNQNLADSNARLAQELRAQVHHLLVNEKADQQAVIEFMVARYGEFVLYQPPVALHTALLWLTPLLLLILGGWMAWRYARPGKVQT